MQKRIRNYKARENRERNWRKKGRKEKKRTSQWKSRNKQTKAVEKKPKGNWWRNKDNKRKTEKKMKRKTDENQSEHSHRATERAKISRPKYCSTEEKAFCERNIRLAISKI